MRPTLWVAHSDRENAINLLADRNLDWLGEWVNHELEQEFPKIGFSDIIRLISSKLIEKPNTDAYITSYANYLMRPNNGWNRKIKKSLPAPSITKQLKASSVLMSDVYNVFRVESMAFNTNSWLQNGAADDYETWPEALLKMEQDGTLDRSRLLEESLSALSKDLKPNQLSGVAKFHKSLKATDQELKQREADYRRLLASQSAPIARLGLDQLSALHKTKNLNVDLCLSELPFILALPTKTHAMAALKFARRIAKSNPAQADAITGVYLAALSHENTDVQSKALEELEVIRDKLSEADRNELSNQAGFVAPHLRSRVTTIAGLSEKTTSTAINEHEPAHEKTELQPPNFTELSDEQIETWGIDGLRKSPFNYHPISSDIIKMRVLHTVETIEPIKTQDELLSEIATYIESGDRMDGERIADGISRIERIEDADFMARVKPIKHRLGLEENTVYAGSGALDRLIYTYLDRRFTRSKLDFKVYSYNTTSAAEDEIANVDSTMSGHFRSLAEIIFKGHLRPRLSMPTHENGWIDARTWVKRLAALRQTDIRLGAIDLYDLAQSLTRLAPDYRIEASNNLSGLQGELRTLAEFVLGKSDLPKLHKNTSFEIWITAARSRNPFKDWTTDFKDYLFGPNYAGMLAPRNLEWNAYSSNLYRDRMKFPHFDKAQQPKKKLLQKQIKIEQGLLPASILCQFDSLEWYDEPTANIKAWHTTLFPLYTRESYINTIPVITCRIDDKANSFQQVHGAFNALFQKNRPWGDTGHLILALGLLGRDADAQGLSLDALIEGPESGQLDPYLLADTFTKLSNANWVKLSRPKPNLEQAAQTSGLHAYIISEILSRWLPNVDRKRRGLSDCLECLLHSASLAGVGLSDEVRQYLRGFSGSSKAAKVAKTLLTLKPIDQDILETIRHQAIESRLRWVNPA